jgi:hypothetical protein
MVGCISYLMYHFSGSQLLGSLSYFCAFLSYPIILEGTFLSNCVHYYSSVCNRLAINFAVKTMAINMPKIRYDKYLILGMFALMACHEHIWFLLVRIFYVSQKPHLASQAGLRAYRSFQLRRHSFCRKYTLFADRCLVLHSLKCAKKRDGLMEPARTTFLLFLYLSQVTVAEHSGISLSMSYRVYLPFQWIQTKHFNSIQIIPQCIFVYLCIHDYIST